MSYCALVFAERQISEVGLQLQERRDALAAENQRLIQAGVEMVPVIASASTSG